MLIGQSTKIVWGEEQEVHPHSPPKQKPNIHFFTNIQQMKMKTQTAVIKTTSPNILSSVEWTKHSVDQYTTKISERCEISTHKTQSERCRSVHNPPMMNQPFQCSVATLRNYGFFWGTNSPMTLMLTQVVYLFWNVTEIVGRALHAMNAWYRSKCNLFDDGSSPLFCETIPAPHFLIASFKVPTCIVSAKL